MAQSFKNKAAPNAFWKAAEAYAHHLADNENQVEIAWLLRGFSDAVTGAGRDHESSQDREYGRYYRKGYSALMIH
jgi:hypothetical protein